MARTIEVAVSDGLAALSRMQSPDGSFPLWTGTSSWRPCGPLFSTVYIMMGSGSRLPVQNVAAAVAYIQTLRRPDGLWEFDDAIGLPPDSDVTACALAALARLGERSNVGNSEKLLRAFWRAPTGPFRTWNVRPLSGPERDDPVVNCNILFALRLLGFPATQAELASVYRLVSRSPSRYYCSASTIAHAAGRAGLDLRLLPPAVTLPPSTQHPLAIMQWLSTVQTAEPKLIDAILKCQREDGSWPIFPWVTAQLNPRPFWGSPAITTALAIEALAHITKPV
jgi:hypothetical protein